MYQPTPGTIQYNGLINDIEKGLIKIPQFQRQFVWSKKESASLLDSIVKGFPIGTFILWKTKERLRAIRNIGGIYLPETPDGDFVQYVLDGQQRMTSVYVSIKGEKIINEDGKVEDYSEIYVDLEADEDGEIVTIDMSNRDYKEFIKVTELISGGLSLAKKYDEKYHQKLEDYANRFKTYSFSTIVVNEAPIDIATEIFTRINVGGKSLSVFEIMVAKTFDIERDFDLSVKYDELIEKLLTVDYETIPSSTVLQAVSVCLVKECSKKHILKLNKSEFIDIWEQVVIAIESAVEYFRNFYRIPVSQLLPYDALLIPFTYFFFKHKDKPIGKKQKYLQDYFWRTVINSRFSNSLETKVGQDIKKIDQILNEELPRYEEGVDISVESLSANGWFATGKAYIKGFLCLLAYHNPLSFIDNSVVNINNNWLRQANSKNYHHFFPRAYLRKKGEDEFYINHIANITIVDDFLNKRQIKDKAPSKYMKEFDKHNKELNKAMESHLIGDLKTFGVLEDDYDTFYNRRLEKFSEELKRRLVIQDYDVIFKYEDIGDEN